eukprot:1456900-Pyramimonas_sp.AAC.1
MAGQPSRHFPLRCSWQTQRSVNCQLIINYRTAPCSDLNPSSRASSPRSASRPGGPTGDWAG